MILIFIVGVVAFSLTLVGLFLTYKEFSKLEWNYSLNYLYNFTSRVEVKLILNGSFGKKINIFPHWAIIRIHFSCACFSWFINISIVNFQYIYYMLNNQIFIASCLKYLFTVINFNKFSCKIINQNP
jgi:hypothetical protein